MSEGAFVGTGGPSELWRDGVGLVEELAEAGALSASE